MKIKKSINSLLSSISVMFLFVMISSNLSAQIPNNIKEYLTKNILNLDPIEGIYAAEFGVQEYIPDYVWPKRITTSEVAITKVADNTYRIHNNNDVTFRKIGDSNIYNLSFKFSVATAETRAYYNNGVLSYGFDIPYEQLRHDRDNHFYKYSAQLIKVYPTSSMYADAARKAIEEESKPTLWTGTGFALMNNYIVTNYHIVDNAKTILVQGINGNFSRKYNASVVASDKYNDLAILKVSGATISNISIPYSVKTVTSEVGEEIFVLGYPLTSTMGDEIKLTTGVISSKTGFQGDVSLYQFSAPVQSGNSGGPLFDSKGNIIGIVSSKHIGAENVGYAIKASYLRNLMESAVSSNILPQNNKISGQNLSGKVKSVKNFVYYITCSSKELNVSNHIQDEVIVYPKVTKNTLEDEDNYTITQISRVNIGSDFTVIELLLKDYIWCNIDPQTYIVANGKKLKMLKAEGIALAPQKTTPSYKGADIKCKLFFPPIPRNTKSIDLIENQVSRWKFYGIQLW